MSQHQIFPSILTADFLHLEKEIEMVNDTEADLLHLDIMDGVFVPNLTFGFPVIRQIKSVSKKPLDVHLMILHADKFIPTFAEAGAEIITIHQEASPHIHRSIQMIKDKGKKAGVSLNPGSSLDSILPILPIVDLVLLMTVNPGFGAQSFIPLVLQKIEQLAEIKQKNQYHFLIEVDGGINSETIPGVVKAGAEVLVAGNAVFAQEDPGKACRQLKDIAGQASEKS